MKLSALVGAALILTAGCSGLRDFTVPEEEARAAQYPPKPADFKKEIAVWMKGNLNDPEATRCEDWRLYRVYVGTKPVTYGWMSTVSMNCKNGFGGYDGYRTFHFSHEGGRAIHLAYLEDGGDQFLPHKFHIVERVE